jgi:site-specific recombinase XerD
MANYYRKLGFKQVILMPPLALPPAAPLVASTDQLTIQSTDLSTRLDDNPAAVYLAQLTTRSRRTQASALAALAQLLGYDDALSCPWSQLRYQHTAAIRAALAEAYAPATANRMLAALRRVVQEAWRLGQMTAEEYRRAADLKVIKAEKLPAGRALSVEEIAALFNACAADATAAGVRDGALIALLIASGLRRSEAVALDVRDYTSATGALTVREGKGRKDRIVYVADATAAAALADWLTIRGSGAGPLWTAATRGGHITTRRMTDQAVALILQKRAQQAGIADVSPHDLRRTFITQLLDHGADIATVQKLAGHADPSTTARYDRRGEAAKQQAAALIALPPLRRTLPLDD